MDSYAKVAYLNGAQAMLDETLKALGEGRGTKVLKSQLMSAYFEVSKKTQQDDQLRVNAALRGPFEAAALPNHASNLN